MDWLLTTPLNEDSHNFSLNDFSSWESIASILSVTRLDMNSVIGGWLTEIKPVVNRISCNSRDDFL